MIVVTGAAGFIGSCIVAALNARGIKDLILVDHWDTHESGLDAKRHNLDGKFYVRFYDKTEFLKLIEQNKISDSISCVIHMGACSSTILQDVDYFEKNNFQYSCALAEWSLKKGARFIYASSAATYGDGSLGYKDDEATTRRLQPLNLYGLSKQKFDEWILDRDLQDKIVGLKFFNVFGPNEYHKGEMRSLAVKSYNPIIKEGKIRLFKSTTPRFTDGGQMRDFVYIKDAVDVVMFFVDHPVKNGIFNLGTGQARSWNDLAKALFKVTAKPVHIEYIDIPETLRDKYQNFTQADMSKLRSAGYQKSFSSLENAITDYVSYLKNHSYL